VWGETIVLGHSEYLIPFLFYSLFGDEHCDNSVNVVAEGCQFVTVGVVG